LGEAHQRVEVNIKSYVDADGFRAKYRAAHMKWAEAEELLWAVDNERQLTTIGHLCREAMQEFVTALVERFAPPNAERDRQKIIARLRAVLELHRHHLQATEIPFLDALLAYWGTICDLVQRQEHGGQREGQALVWEDGRRVVFQTAVVMFEIDRSLSRAAASVEGSRGVGDG
jgi:hypothetical protein